MHDAAAMAVADCCMLSSHVQYAVVLELNYATAFVAASVLLRLPLHCGCCWCLLLAGSHVLTFGQEPMAQEDARLPGHHLQEHKAQMQGVDVMSASHPCSTLEV
jgi:hypothetical protein